MSHIFRGKAESETQFRERQCVADKVALELLWKTYDELAQLAEGEARADAFLAEHGFDNQLPLHVALSVGKAVWVRKRVCVEINVVSQPFSSRERPGCVYFEKFLSGKLVVYGLRA